MDKHATMLMEEKAGFKKQNSKKGLQKNEHACSVEAVSQRSDVRPYLELACPIQQPE